MVDMVSEHEDKMLAFGAGFVVLSTVSTIFTAFAQFYELFVVSLLLVVLTGGLYYDVYQQIHNNE